jgi:hypothetical protein
MARAFPRHVPGQQLYEITDEQRAAVTAVHPRPDLKSRIPNMRSTKA